ncbi:MAG: hypothetical protein ACRC1K_24380 [Planctomycetia bacterium]
MFSNINVSARYVEPGSAFAADQAAVAAAAAPSNAPLYWYSAFAFAKSRRFSAAITASTLVFSAEAIDAAWVLSASAAAFS